MLAFEKLTYFYDSPLIKPLQLFMMPRLVVSVFFLGIFLCAEMSAQNLNNPMQSFKERRVFIYGIDNRRTNIANQHTVIYGAYVGLGFGGKLRYKLGISGTPFEISETTDAGAIRTNRLLFLSLGEEFDFLQFKRLTCTTYLQAGAGRNFYSLFDEKNNTNTAGRDFILPLEAGLNFGYTMYNWLELKTGIGYRIVLPAYAYRLDGIYLKLGASVNVKELKNALEAKRME